MDIDDLELGSVVEASTIEHVLSCNVDDRNYGIKKLALAQFIENEWQSERGFRCTIKHRGDSLVILPHSEASRENPQRLRRALRTAGRAQQRNLDVDPSEFDADDRERHARNLEVDGKTLSAARKARRQALMPTPVKRDQLPPMAEKVSKE